MISPYSPSICKDVPSLPDEQIEFVLDARAGLLDQAVPGSDALIVTNRRVARAGAGHGSRVLTLLPLSNVSAVEVLDAGRSLDRLGQGVLLLAVGLALGGGSWVVLGVQALSVLLGGLPALAGVYALAGWAFPDAEGQMRIHTFGQVVAQPLRSGAARRDAYAAASRLYALTWSEDLAGADIGVAEEAEQGAQDATDGAAEEAEQGAQASADGAEEAEQDAQDAADRVAEEAEQGAKASADGVAEEAEQGAKASADGVAEEAEQGAQDATDGAADAEAEQGAQPATDGAAEAEQGAQPAADGAAEEAEQGAGVSPNDDARANSIWDRIRGSSAR